MGWTLGWRKCLAQGVVSNSADVQVPTHHQWTPLHCFTSALQMAACCRIKPWGCFLLLRRALGCGLCLYDRKMYTLLFLVPWVYPRLEGVSVPTPAGSWELWWKKRERNHHLQIIHWAFFHSFYSACTFVCCVACVLSWSRAALPPSLPPSRQSACLFMYGLNHASMKMPRWFSQNNTLSLDRKRDITNFPAAPCAKLAPYHFQTLRKETLMFPSSLDKNRNNLDVRLHPRIYVLGYVLHTEDRSYYSSVFRFRFWSKTYLFPTSIVLFFCVDSNYKENSCC